MTDRPFSDKDELERAEFRLQHANAGVMWMAQMNVHGLSLADQMEQSIRYRNALEEQAQARNALESIVRKQRGLC